MVKFIIFIWATRVFYSIFPGSNPLNIIFRIIFISSVLFLLFAYKGGRSIGFLWVLVYIGGILIVFLYLIFLTLMERELIRLDKWEKREKLKKNSFFFQVLMAVIIISFFFKLNFSGGGGRKRNKWIRRITSPGTETQEFYRLFMSISCKSVFRILLLVIRLSLFLYLGILNKKIMQSKVSFFFHFIIKNYIKFPILRSLGGMKYFSFS